MVRRCEKYRPSTTIRTTPRVQLRAANEATVRASAHAAAAQAATATAATRSARTSIRRGRVTRSSSTPATGPRTNGGTMPLATINETSWAPACRTTTAATATAVLVSTLPKVEATCATVYSRRSDAPGPASAVAAVIACHLPGRPPWRASADRGDHHCREPSGTDSPP